MFALNQNLLNAVGVKDCSVLITFGVLWMSLVICALSLCITEEEVVEKWLLFLYK